MSEKDDIEKRARYVAGGGDRPAPPAYKPESNWQSIVYRIIAAVIYFVIFWIFRFWSANPIIVIFFVIIGLWIFADGPRDINSFVTWIVMIVVVFGGIGWLITMSPYRTTIQNYYNEILTPFTRIAEAANDVRDKFIHDYNCAVNYNTCKPTDAATTQRTTKSLEITTLSSESSVAVGKSARLFAAIANQGEADATVKYARMYGGEGKNFKVASNLQCAGCAIGITNEKIIPNSRRDLTADIATPCEKISTYPFSLNMEYEYSVGASLPIDVLNSKDYDATAAKEVFLTQPAADSSSGPVRASVSVGVEGYQPVKGGTKNILFAKLTNLGSGQFKLKNAQVAVRYNVTHNFTLSSCKVNGVAVDDPINMIDPSGRYYGTEKFVSLSCDMDVKDVEGQKRFIATIDAAYVYNITKSASIELDQTGFDACNAAATRLASRPSAP